MRGEIPVAAGAPRPLVLELHVTGQVHGETGLDGPDLTPPSRGAGPAHAIDWIASTISGNPDPVTLVATGPLTNVALFLVRHPELQGRLARVVLMGGAIGERSDSADPRQAGAPSLHVAALELDELQQPSAVVCRLLGHAG